MVEDDELLLFFVDVLLFFCVEENSGEEDGCCPVSASALATLQALVPSVSTIHLKKFQQNSIVSQQLPHHRRNTS